MWVMSAGARRGWPDAPLRLRLLMLLAWVCVLPGASGSRSISVRDGWTPGAYPNPQLAPGACGRGEDVRRSWVCDPSRVLSQGSANVVEGILSKIATGEGAFVAQPCPAPAGAPEGYQVAVALVDKLDMSGCASGAQCMQAFAEQVMDAWGVGSPVCANGVLLAMSTKDRQLYIATGYGSKALLPVNVLRAVVEAMKPDLRAGLYDTAVENAVMDLGLAVAGLFPPRGGGHDGGDPERHDGEEDDLPIWIGAALFLILALLALVGEHVMCERYQECRTKLQVLKRAQENAALGQQYVARSCPICLEDFDVAVGLPIGGGSKDGGDAVSFSASLSAVEEGREAAKEGGNVTSEPSVPSEDATSHLLSNPRAAAAPAAALPRLPAPAPQRRRPPTAAAVHKPWVLSCGHGFCESCISQWLEDHTTCPICRKGVDEGGRRRGGAAGVVQATRPWTASSLDPDVQQELLQQELSFRVRSIHRLFPHYVSASMAQTFGDGILRGECLNADMWRQFELQDPAMRHANEVQGSHGATGDFGGGGHSDHGGGHSGGGYGDSW